MAKKALIAPLHWGLGHATRCIPLALKLEADGWQLVVAAVGGCRALLHEALPTATFIDVPNLPVRYTRNPRLFVPHALVRLPVLLWSLWAEHRWLARVCATHQFQLVVSDSRPGLWHPIVRSVYVCHQLHIMAPLIGPMLRWAHGWCMRKFNEVWVPDFQDEPSLAALLSHPKAVPTNARYIGPLSRFAGRHFKPSTAFKNVAVVSGPEPHRSVFLEQCIERFMATGSPSLVVSGQPDKPADVQRGCVRVVGHMDDDELASALLGASLVLSRSGYSSIMDYHALGVTAELLPTPGQPEQEYLARWHGGVFRKEKA